jgi:hypothetical protein
MGAARPDELAVGVAEALVTTCEGLIVAIPLMFFHLYFRGRVTRIGQAAGGVCEGVLRGLAAVIEARTTGRPVEQDLRPTQGPTEVVVEEYELEARPGEVLSPDDLHFEDDEAGRA